MHGFFRRKRLVMLTNSSGTCWLSNTDGPLCKFATNHHQVRVRVRTRENVDRSWYTWGQHGMHKLSMYSPPVDCNAHRATLHLADYPGPKAGYYYPHVRSIG